MKRLFLFPVLLLSVLCSTSALAQTESQFYQNEIKVEINDGLPPTFLFAFGDAIDDVIQSNQNEISDEEDITPFLSITYNHFLSHKLAVGVDVGYYSYQTDEVYEDQDTHEKTYAHSNWTLFSIAPNIKYIYVDHPAFDFYGRALIGLLYGHSASEARSGSGTNTDSGNALFFMAQVMPLGVRFGRAFGGFVELGFGMKGFIGLGLSYKF